MAVEQNRFSEKQINKLNKIGFSIFLTRKDW